MLGTGEMSGYCRGQGGRGEPLWLLVSGVMVGVCLDSCYVVCAAIGIAVRRVKLCTPYAGLGKKKVPSCRFWRDGTFFLPIVEGLLYGVGRWGDRGAGGVAGSPTARLSLGEGHAGGRLQPFSLKLHRHHQLSADPNRYTPVTPSHTRSAGAWPRWAASGPP